MWECTCGEKLEDEFDTCWSCGKARSGDLPANPDVFEAGREIDAQLESDPDGSEETAPLFSPCAVTLKEETIVDEWAAMVRDAAAHVDRLINDIQERLENADIPGGCTWALKEVKSSTWVQRVRREFLIVRLEQFKDYRIYISIREYGRYLYASRFTTVEPGFFKKKISEKLWDDSRVLSAPKNILVWQDLNAWNTAVHNEVYEATKALVDELGQDSSTLRRESKGFLQVW